ncbi:UrcA family protein [Sphingomonas sp. DBB INV C78]|uniref:UrcA family protein n=1 Tax=Sphingomonas sp. DBB INV C78 TaxID=3349434 RepID=UPI0036D2A058
MLKPLLLVRVPSLGAIGAILLVTTPSTASIRPVEEQFATARVSYADLNLSTAEGRATLDRRISRAARRVCVMAPDHRETSCRRHALELARPQVLAAVERAQKIQVASALPVL